MISGLGLGLGLGYAVAGLQGVLLLALTLFSLVVKGFALVDALRRRPQLFVAAGKQTKNIWLAILGVALAVGIVVLNPLGFLSIIGLVAAIVYLVDVRPALAQLGGGGGSSSGPYGGW